MKTYTSVHIIDPKGEFNITFDGDNFVDIRYNDDRVILSIGKEHIPRFLASIIESLAEEKFVIEE